MSFRLVLPRRLHEEMIAQALREAPNECCGLFAGVVRDGVGTVERIYPLVNGLASPVLYESDPRSMLDAYRDMTARGLDVVSVYHSHPASAPVPSKTDLERNYSEEVVNLIVSLAESPPLARGWWLTATGYREAAWEVA
jgi:[CysO sulfur-carrier protein]-S-L-cysteine hydrolase